jgi:hypothetical protein
VGVDFVVYQFDMAFRLFPGGIISRARQGSKVEEKRKRLAGSSQEIVRVEVEVAHSGIPLAAYVSRKSGYEIVLLSSPTL